MGRTFGSSHLFLRKHTARRTTKSVANVAIVNLTIPYLHIHTHNTHTKVCALAQTTATSNDAERELIPAGFMRKCACVSV